MTQDEALAALKKVVLETIPEEFHDHVWEQHGGLTLPHWVGGYAHEIDKIGALSVIYPHLDSKGNLTRVEFPCIWQYNVIATEYKKIDSAFLKKRIKLIYKHADADYQQRKVWVEQEKKEAAKIYENVVVPLIAEYGAHFKMKGSAVYLHIGNTSARYEHEYESIRLGTWDDLMIPIDLAVPLFQELALRSLLED